MHDLDFTKAPVTDILKKLNEAIENSPDEISVNVILTGNGAKRYHIVKTLLLASYPELDDIELEKFIVRSGVERELARFSEIWNEQ